MKTVFNLKKHLVALFAVLLLGTGLQLTIDPAGAQPAWMPSPPKALPGTKCDADPKWMRTWHMRKLDHKRDQTVRDGIRTKKFSLKRCITCHAVKDESGKFLTVKDERHFCRSCHDYTAVRIDCFDCHASRPDSKKGQGAMLKNNPHDKTGRSSSLKPGDKAVASLQKYLAGETK